MKFEFSGQMFKIYSNIKLNENPSSGGPSFSMRRFRRTARQTDIDKAKNLFSYLAKAPKNGGFLSHSVVKQAE
jgi:hypothetical protein